MATDDRPLFRGIDEKEDELAGHMHDPSETGAVPATPMSDLLDPARVRDQDEQAERRNDEGEPSDR